MELAQNSVPNVLSGRTRVHRRVGINTLPFDVLVTIFEIVYHISRKVTCFGMDATSSCEYWAEADPLDPTAFPEALFGVCPLWAQALSRISLFWTCLAISVDDQPTSQDTILRYLALSADRPLHILISRKSSTFGIDDPLEPGRVDVVMKLLLPNISRWKSFHVDVRHSSSLPLPNIDIHGVAENLLSMRLVSRIDDKQPRIQTGPTILQASNLEAMDISGWTFRDVYFPGPRTFAESVELLKISQYDSHTQPIPFPVHELVASFESLPKLLHVTLVDLALDCFQDEEDVGLAFGYMPEVVAFQGIHAPVLAEFFRACNYFIPGTLILSQCSLPAGIDFSELDSLFLNDLGADAGNIHDVLDTWDGLYSKHLVVNNCPIFDTEVLMNMSGLDDARRMCPHLEDLSLANCPLLTSGAVRRMVESRWIDHAATGFAHGENPNFTVSSIDTLSVRECGALAPEDKEWLSTHVKKVHWDEWVGGTMPGQQIPGTRRADHLDDE